MTGSTAGTAEGARLASADSATAPWRRWGPYLSERAWGTVREDYSADGDAWGSFPHEHARSRTYRWSEDGLAGVCDDSQTFCFALALWNGADPILKERVFGLSGPEGNHGEDAKECWWYLDSTPTHSFMRWRYHYPQGEFPYADLVEENARRRDLGRLEPEYELVDTGAFDADRYWAVDVTYAKAAPDDLLALVSVTNRSAVPATIHVLPTLWFRNTWAWGLPTEPPAPTISAALDDGPAVVATHTRLGDLCLVGAGEPELLFCDNETHAEKLYGVPGRSAYPKDGIGDHVVRGLPTVNPDRRGTKAALHYVLTVGPGETAEVRLRLSAGDAAGDLGTAWETTMATREREADEFFAALTPPGVDADRARVVRQAVAGLMWGKQFFHYDVARWLAGDPAGPVPPPERLTGRNCDWWHLNNHDVISMPDPWEYPWYAAWDLAFHCVPLAHVDPAFAKRQLLVLLREWYMHPNGQLPAYEWELGDVNPPVHAWAALKVFEIDGSRDYAFLSKVFQKLLLNFTWWVNRKDTDGNNVFEGGFLGLDNIGPLDRSKLPEGVTLEQSDGTAWMATFCLSMLEIALVLAEHDPVYEDMTTKFFEHFAYIGAATYSQGLWDEDDGFFYDVLRLRDGSRVPMRVRSLVGLLPLCATTTLGEATLARLPWFGEHMRWFLENRPDYSAVVRETHERDGAVGQLLAVVEPVHLPRLLAPLLDESEFLSPYGIRSLSARHHDEPFTVDVGGSVATVDYEPAESSSPLYGGNSNWRGPVWFPVNYLIVEAVRRFARFYGDDLRVEHPTGSGRHATLSEVADDLSDRLVRLFLDDADGRRPVFGAYELFQRDAHWHDLLPFHEYFHGDTGAGLGAAHQTGWTALVADLVLRPHG